MNPTFIYRRGGNQRIASLAIFFCIISTANAQTNLDRTDSLSNIANQFVIRFDVATGNIYMPYKKKIKLERKRSNEFALHAFKRKDVSPTYSKTTILYKDSPVNDKIIKVPYGRVDVPRIEEYNQENNISYVKGKWGLKPRVGNFVRMVFENVPKNMDVFANMEFVDKNMENASMAEGFLNSYAGTLGEGVKKDTSEIIKGITKQMESTIAVADQQRKDQQATIDSAKTALKNEIDSVKNAAMAITSAKINPEVKNGPDLSKITKSIDGMKAYITSLALDSIGSHVRWRIDSFMTEIKRPVDNIFIKDKDYRRLDTLVGDLERQSKIFLERTNTYLLETAKIYDTLREEVARLKTRLAFVYDSVYNRRTVYMQAIQVQNSDLSIINITFRTDKEPGTDIQREITLKNKFGFKLDFSTGFLGTGLVDSNYKVLRAPNTGNDTSYISPDSRGSFAVGFALLAHAYFRTGNRLNFALNTGLMLNGSNQTINYLTGFSIPMGLEQRFIISGGVAFGKVKRLANYYTTSKNYGPNELTAASNPIIERWDKNWYFGVSYNLSSLTKGKRNVVIAKP